MNLKNLKGLHVKFKQKVLFHINKVALWARNIDSLH